MVKNAHVTSYALILLSLLALSTQMKQKSQATKLKANPSVVKLLINPHTCEPTKHTKSLLLELTQTLEILKKEFIEHSKDLEINYRSALDIEDKNRWKGFLRRILDDYLDLVKDIYRTIQEIKLEEEKEVDKCLKIHEEKEKALKLKKVVNVDKKLEKHIRKIQIQKITKQEKLIKGKEEKEAKLKAKKLIKLAIHKAKKEVEEKYKREKEEREYEESKKKAFKTKYQHGNDNDDGNSSMKAVIEKVFREKRRQTAKSGSESSSSSSKSSSSSSTRIKTIKSHSTSGTSSSSHKASDEKVIIKYKPFETKKFFKQTTTVTEEPSSGGSSRTIESSSTVVDLTNLPSGPTPDLRVTPLALIQSFQKLASTIGLPKNYVTSRLNIKNN